MSSNRPEKHTDNDESSKQQSGHGSSEPSPSEPTWRSVALLSRHDHVPEVATVARSPPSSKPHESTDVIIDKSSYFLPSEDPFPDAEEMASNWVPLQLRPVPAFYPLEKSSRFVDDSLSAVASRISECLRVLSVQAIYDNEMATASLMTSENVEMHLSLWRTNGGKYPDGIIVELQRRKGCSITFHRYSRHVLDAAIGDFDGDEHTKKFGEDMDRAYSKKVQRLLNLDSSRTLATEQENAIIAIEIAHGLMKKDRMDARQLGLESLCLLTDPRKTSITTAYIASQIVLLGKAQVASPDGEEDVVYDETPFLEIREIILSLVQFNRIGDEADFSDDEDEKEDDFGEGGGHPEEREHLNILHNLALAVLANALNVIENEEGYDSEPEDIDKKPRARARTESASSITSTFMDEAKDFSQRDILSTLIQELGKAERKPHNACLSAKCIGSLCRASEDARRRAKELGAKNIVSTALEVGVRTHLKLETECKKVVDAMNQPDEEN